MCYKTCVTPENMIRAAESYIKRFCVHPTSVCASSGLCIHVALPNLIFNIAFTKNLILQPWAVIEYELCFQKTFLL